MESGMIDMDGEWDDPINPRFTPRFPKNFDSFKSAMYRINKAYADDPDWNYEIEEWLR